MKHLSFILVILAGLFLAACGVAAPQPDVSSPDNSNITIEMSESKYTPNNIELKVGQKVTVMLKNVGEKDHELMIGRNVMIMDGAPNGFEHDFFEGEEPMVMKGEAMGGETMDQDEGEMEDMDHDEGEMAMDQDHMDHTGFMVLLPHGSEDASITFTVTEDMVGEWEMGCFTDDGQHYEDGMKGTLVVKM